VKDDAEQTGAAAVGVQSDVLSRIQDAISGTDMDAIIACSPENFAYLAGFVVPSHHILRWRHSMLVVKKRGDVCAFTVDMEQTTVKKHLPDVPVTSWREFGDNAMKVLAGMLEDLGLAAATLGIETDYLPAADMAMLNKFLPKAKFLPAQDLFARSRMIKTPRELNILRRLSRISDAGINRAYENVQVGSSEMAIASHLTDSIYSDGAQDFKFMIVATGERSQLPNVGPSERQLQAGDICRVEIFSIIDGYHAGVCRTAYVQTPPEHAETIWAVLSDATQMLLETIKPGASSRAIYDAYLNSVAGLDMPAIAFVGHGIGLHLHEEPYLGATNDTPLEAGMVLGIEPLIYQTGHGYGMQNKDMIAVTQTGCELLSDRTETTSLIKIS
jgi:Xaa-Pro aminopeptidase